MADLRGAVQDLLGEQGYSVTFRRVTEGAYDPATGQTGASSTDDETVIMAFLDYKIAEIDGSQIQRGDRKAILSAYDSSGGLLSKAPRVNDQFVGEGDKVSVVDVQTIKSAGVVVGYICQVRE